jgi:uncharacterized protein YaiE (UPF0345 family)
MPMHRREIDGGVESIEFQAEEVRGTATTGSTAIDNTTFAVYKPEEMQLEGLQH